jgi:hypothetical protein
VEVRRSFVMVALSLAGVGRSFVMLAGYSFVMAG